MTAQTRIRWGNPPAGIQNAPIYLGTDRGTFGERSIRLEVRDHPTGADSQGAIQTGEPDMGHGGAPNVFAALARTDQYALVGLGLVKHPPFSLVARPGVRSVRDLTDRVVAINKRRTCSHAILGVLLRRAGMQELGIRLATAGDGPAIVESIRSGQAAGAILWEPYVSHVQRVFGWSVLAEGRTLMSPSNYSMVIYARRSLLATQAGLVADMLASYEHCVRTAQSDTALAARLVAERMPEIALADVEAGVRKEAVHWTADTRLDHELLDRIAAELRKEGIVPELFEPSRITWTRGV